MTHCLDTSTLVSFLRQPNASHPLLEGTRRVGRTNLVIPTPTRAEILAGTYASDARLASLADVMTLLDAHPSLPFDEAAAEAFGKCSGALIRQRLSIGRVDLMIASIALVHDLTVVTINVKEFQLVPGLRIENWL